MSKIVEVVIFIFILGVLMEGNFGMFLFLIIGYFFVGRKLKLAEKIADIFKNINETNKNYYSASTKTNKSLSQPNKKYKSAISKQNSYHRIKSSQQGNKYHYEDGGIIYTNSSRKKCPRCGSLMKNKEGFKGKYYTCTNISKCSYLERIPIIIKK